MADTLGCPHCHAEIPHGARVCRGCQAEVEYGPPRWAKIVALFAGVIAAINLLNRWSLTVAAVGGVAVVLALYFASRKVFANRISVRRLYRT
jgi:hypothetical protein